MTRAAASYRQLHPALNGPGLVPLWLALLGRRTVTDDDVQAALDAARQWPATKAARTLIEGTVAKIAAESPPGGSLLLAPGISPENLARLVASLRQTAS
jgi:hypothetical protein